VLAFMEDFRRGWARGRAVEAPARVPEAGNAETEKTASLAEVTALADQLEKRNAELEAELASSPAALYAAALRLPGVKTMLVSKFAPDKHPDANDAERERLTEQMQTVNAAYEALNKRADGQ
jgi:hypothetical protein